MFVFDANTGKFSIDDQEIDHMLAQEVLAEMDAADPHSTQIQLQDQFGKWTVVRFLTGDTPSYTSIFA